MEKNKICQKCKVDKPPTEYHADQSRADGLSYVCKPCRRSERRSRYLDDRDRLISEYDPKEARARRLRYTYGMTQEDYNKMYQKQSGKCLICLEEKKLFIDHCHSSGKVRGLLCTTCNTSLGGFKDSLENLQRAIQYLGGNE